MQRNKVRSARMLLFFPGFLIAVAANSQGNKRYNVAILLYNNVQILDFSGPAEVFSNSMNTYTVTIDGKPIVSGGLLQITPNYSFANAPDPDLIVLPVGRTTPANDSVTLRWIKKQRANGVLCMSVCNGAFMLANTGILNDKIVT